jgi:hypothetical protein
MLFSTTHRHLPRRGPHPPLRGDAVTREEFIRLSAQLQALQREQEIQFKRFAQIQHELDVLKKLREKMRTAQ